MDVQSQGGNKMLNVAGQGGGGSWKLGNFHGRHMCIIPYDIYDVSKSYYQKEFVICFLRTTYGRFKEFLIETL